MLTSLRARLWLTYALIVGVVIAVLGAALILYLIGNPAESRHELERLRLISLLIVQRSAALDLPAGRLDEAGVLAALERVDQTFNARIILLDTGGQVLVDTRAELAPALPGLARWGNRRPNALPLLRDATGRLWLVAVHTDDQGRTLVVTAPRPRTAVLSVLRDEFFTPFAQAIGLALLLALGLAFWVARWVAAPLQRMAGAAREVASHPLDAQVQPIPLEGPQEVRQLGRAFNEMTARVVASQRSQRDFVANVSHELKTPLTSIQGFAQAILDGTVDDEESLQQAAGVILSESGRMHRLVLDLLDLARMDAGTAAFERQQLDLTAILDGILEKLSPQAHEAGVGLQKTYTRLPAMDGDGDRLAQVFTNLVDNAIQHTPQGGEVRISGTEQAGWVEVAVSDGGPGIPSQSFDRIFERFYQIDDSRSGGDRRGAGLGLAIAREIVLAHGGQITASNQPDSGAIFVVKLPVRP
jgi:signal transduction histidine kinase